LRPPISRLLEERTREIENQTLPGPTHDRLQVDYTGYRTIDAETDQSVATPLPSECTMVIGTRNDYSVLFDQSETPPDRDVERDTIPGPTHDLMEVEYTGYRTIDAETDQSVATPLPSECTMVIGTRNDCSVLFDQSETPPDRDVERDTIPGPTHDLMEVEYTGYPTIDAEMVNSAVTRLVSNCTVTIETHNDLSVLYNGLDNRQSLPDGDVESEVLLYPTQHMIESQCTSYYITAATKAVNSEETHVEAEPIRDHWEVQATYPHHRDISTLLKSVRSTKGILVIAGAGISVSAGSTLFLGEFSFMVDG
jgi:hypothetical protein